MTLINRVQALRDRLELVTWIRSTENLRLLRRRLHRELPAPYLRGFYRTWVFGHARARLRLQGLPPGVPAPLTIKVSPTQKCNLRCRGCFASHYTAPTVLDRQVLDRVLDEATQVGVHTVGVIGGEPLLWPGIFDLLRDHPDTGFYLVTNGTLLDDEVAWQLQDLPNVVTIFSVEGLRETNDFLRGEGVFDKVMASMAMLREARVLFGFSTTVHRDNVDEVVSGPYLDWMIERGASFGGFLPYVPVGAAPRYDLVCDEDEVAAYYRRLDELVAHRPIGVLKEGYADGSFFNQGCRAASTLHVTSDGLIEPCNGIEFATLDVQHGSLRDALDSPFFQAIRDLHPQGGRRCLVDTEPEALLEIVERFQARETHPGALTHLREFVSSRSVTGGAAASGS